MGTNRTAIGLLILAMTALAPCALVREPSPQPQLVTTATRSYTTPWVGLPVSLPPLTPPIPNATVPTDPQALPGALREYRGGVHEGVDFRCAPGTPVRAALAGWVLSVEDRQDLPLEIRRELLEQCSALGRTPQLVLDILHGRRLVLYHGMFDGNLLTTSYSHAAEIRTDLVPGAWVEPGEIIAWTGASGTSHAYKADHWSELHFELRINGLPVGLGLSSNEAGALYRSALTDEVVGQ